MRTNNRVAAVGVTLAAALAVGTFAVAAPVATAAAPRPQDSVQAGLFKRKWTGTAVWDEGTGTWRAQISNGRDSALLPSTYDTRQAAQNDADETADRMNGNVVADPACKPPVLC